jgi:hypothetical protein
MRRVYGESCFEVVDANKQAIAYVYGRETKADADVLTRDEAWRLALAPPVAEGAMKRVIIALAVLVLTMPAVAQDTGGLGAGAIKCSQITAEMDDQIRNIAYSWAEGFMTAVNLCTGASIQKYRNLAALSRDAQERFIRNYCLQHPNEDYQNAVWALLNTLPIMAHTP